MYVLPTYINTNIFELESNIDNNNILLFKSNLGEILSYTESLDFT